jgi:hypothetical protein
MLKPKIFLAPMLLLGLVFTVNFITMPKWPYPGDSTSIKIAAINLVVNKEFGIQPHVLQRYGLGPSYIDTFFYFNTAQGSYFTRWSLMNVFVSSIPEWFVPHRPDYIEVNKSLLAHNLFNILLSCALALYLFKLTLLLGFSRAQGLAHVIFCFYGTFLWNYLRAQSYELWQVFLMVALVYHLVLPYYNSTARRWTHFWLFNFYLALLCLLKESYFILYPLFLIFGHYFYRQRKLNTVLVASGLVSFTILLCFNKIQFGSFFFFNKFPTISFSSQFILPRLYDYFLNPVWNIFFNFIPLLLAVWGLWYGFKQHKLFYSLAAALFGIILFFHSFYLSVGEVCYGPRYLLPILPILSIPSLYLYQYFSTKVGYLKYGLFSLLALLFGYFSYLQVLVISHAFFLKYKADSFFQAYGQPAAHEYFVKVPEPYIVKDLVFFAQKGEIIYPVDSILHTVAEAQRMPMLEKIYVAYRKSVTMEYNFYFSRGNN